MHHRNPSGLGALTCAYIAGAIAPVVAAGPVQDPEPVVVKQELLVVKQEQEPEPARKKQKTTAKSNAAAASNMNIRSFFKPG